MSDRSRVRLVILQVLVLSLLVTLLGRLWYLQVMAGDRYQAAAADNRIRDVVTPAVRGQILDDHGRPLVSNRTAMVVSVDRTALLAQADGGRAVLHRLAGTLGMPFKQLHARIQLCGTPNAPRPPVCWNGSPYQPIPVVEDAPTRVALQIMERHEDFQGVTAELQAVREYPKPYQVNAAHILGYLGPVTDQELKAQQSGRGSNVQLQSTDLIGRAGLEQVYDRYLRGRDGVQQLAVDHTGAVVGTVSDVPPAAGDLLVTSIDAKLQAIVERQLRAAIARSHTLTDPNGQRYRADSGAAIVMDVTNGRVLAMASYPSYNPSMWVGGVTDKQYKWLISPKAGAPLVSRAVQGQYAPASTFKIVSTSAAVAAGFPLHGLYPCPPSLTIGGRSFSNFESESFGDITFQKALEISCDTVYYGIAYDLWKREGGLSAPVTLKDPFTQMAKAFGYGRATGVDLPAEAPGRIADRWYRKQYWEQTHDYYCHYRKRAAPDQLTPYLIALADYNCHYGYQYLPGDAVLFAIGQGDTLATPLQVARAYSAIANGGTLYTPQLAKAVVRPDGTVVKEFAPKKAGTLPVAPETLAYIRQALSQVPVSGTATYPFLGFPLNKVPIAAKTGTGEVYGSQTTSWFASYAPANNPRYAVVMTVPEGGTGALTSGPSVRKIYEALFGVNGQTVDPSKALFPTGSPPASLPRIKPDGTIVLPGSTPSVSTPGPSAATPAAALAAERVPSQRLRRDARGRAVRRRRQAGPWRRRRTPGPGP